MTVEFFSIPQAAVMLGVHRSTVYRMINDDEITPSTIGRRKKVHISQIEKHIPKEN